MATDDFFRARLDQMIDLQRPLAMLANRMPWAQIESALGPAFAHRTCQSRTVAGSDLFDTSLQIADPRDQCSRPATLAEVVVDLSYRGVGRDNPDVEINARRSLISRFAVLLVMLFIIIPVFCKHSAPSAVAATGTTTTNVASGPTYYISPNGNDSSNGSASTPWRTVQKAANTVNAGDTVVLMDGTYTEGSVNIDRSGTADKPIVFKAQNKWKAMIASTSGCNPGFSIHGSYITVKDLAFSVVGPACTTFTSTNTHIRAWNTVVATPSNPTTGSAGFHADGLKLTRGRAGGLALKSNQDYTIIENVEVDGALELFSTKNSIIRNNLVIGQDEAGNSIGAKGGDRNAQIYNNVIRNNHPYGMGIWLGGFSCDTCFFDKSTKIEAYNSVAYNNILINDSGTLTALVFAGAKDSAFFNNVVVGGGVLTKEGGYNSGFRAPTTNPTLMNNIIVCNGAQARSGAYSGTLRIESNNFFNCSGTPSQTNAIVGDPLLVNAGSDWNLQPASPARNRGSQTSFVGYDGVAIDLSHDKNGVVRTTPWDLGVYNY